MMEAHGRRQRGCIAVAALVVALALVSTAPPCVAALPELKIGVLAKRGPEKAIAQWEPTFVDYLNTAVPAYNFSMVPLGFAAIYPAVAEKTVDFMFANPSFFACLERQYGCTAALTLLNSRNGFATAEFGGVIFARTNASDINTVNDTSNKVVEVVDYSSLGGFQMQWGVFDNDGVNPFIFPSQLRFANTHDNVVMDVLNGYVDVGCVRTDTMERMAAEGLIDLKDFKIINNRTTDNFPFLHSTQLYSEWPFAVLPHVPRDTAVKVTQALYNIPANSAYTTAGKYVGWVTPRSYLSVHQLFTDIGFLLPDGSCRRTDNLYDGLFCPTGYHKPATNQFIDAGNNCTAQCPTGYTCACRACRKAVDATLVLSPHFVVLGSALESNVSVCLPAEPLRDVHVEAVLAEQQGGGIVIVEGSQTFTLTPENWQACGTVQLQLHPEAVLLGNQEATLLLQVTSEDPDYNELPDQTLQVAVQWPTCSTADFTAIIGTCDSSSLSQSIKYAWLQPLASSGGAKSAVCAGGEELPADTSTSCTFVPPSSPLAVAVASVTTLLLLLDAAAMVFIWLRRNVRRGIIQRSQPPFLLIIGAGAVPAYAFVVTVGHHATEVTCRVRPLLLLNAFALIFGSLVIKSWRVHRILNNKTITKKLRLTTPRMLTRLAALVGTNAGLLLLWVLLDPPKIETIAHQVGFAVIEYPGCTIGSPLWVGLVLVYNLGVAIAGVVLAYKVRNVGAGFEESKYTCIALYSLTCVAVLVIPIYAISGLDPLALYLVLVVAVLLGATGTLGLIIGPKIVEEVHLMRHGPPPRGRNVRNPLTTTPSRAGRAGRAVGGPRKLPTPLRAASNVQLSTVAAKRGEALGSAPTRAHSASAAPSPLSVAVVADAGSVGSGAAGSHSASSWSEGNEGDARAEVYLLRARVMQLEGEVQQLRLRRR